jgi:alpha-mannosidase
VSDGKIGLAVASRGLPEFEARREGRRTTLYVTLLRSVGWLSRSDLLTRRGAAGPVIATPDAQCIGRHHFHLSLIPFAGSWLDAGVAQEAERFCVPLATVAATRTGNHAPVMKTNGYLHWLRSARVKPGAAPAERSIVFCTDPQLMISAVKVAEDGVSLVVRVWNPATRRRTGRLCFFHPLSSAQSVNLNEEPLPNGELEVRHGHEVPIEAGPRQVRTVRVQFR